MYPLLFGDAAQRLYGTYHMPRTPGPDGIGVVLCNPVLHEYAASHRPFCVLAERLAHSGVHALRFDYHGTGDSAGEGEEADVDRWIANIGHAIDELVASRGVERVGLIGLRLGATMAALASARRDDMDFLVLWDPIPSGDSYVDGLRVLHQHWLAFESENQPDLKRHSTAFEILGHPFSAEFERDLRRVQLSDLGSTSAKRVLIAGGAESAALGAVGARFEELGVSVECEALDAGQFVMQSLEIDQAKVPREILIKIVDWVTGLGR
jgi:pimeloyl-ACP methyl ester carboxylesterase